MATPDANSTIPAATTFSQNESQQKKPTTIDTSINMRHCSNNNGSEMDERPRSRKASQVGIYERRPSAQYIQYQHTRRRSSQLSLRNNRPAVSESELSSPTSANTTTGGDKFSVPVGFIGASRRGSKQHHQPPNNFNNNNNNNDPTSLSSITSSNESVTRKGYNNSRQVSSVGHNHNHHLSRKNSFKSSHLGSASSISQQLDGQHHKIELLQKHPSMTTFDQPEFDLVSLLESMDSITSSITSVNSSHSKPYNRPSMTDFASNNHHHSIASSDYNLNSTTPPVQKSPKTVPRRFMKKNLEPTTPPTIIPQDERKSTTVGPPDNSAGGSITFNTSNNNLASSSYNLGRSCFEINMDSRLSSGSNVSKHQQGSKDVSSINIHHSLVVFEDHHHSDHNESEEYYDNTTTTTTALSNNNSKSLKNSSRKLGQSLGSMANLGGSVSTSIKNKLGGLKKKLSLGNLSVGNNSNSNHHLPSLTAATTNTSNTGGDSSSSVVGGG